MTRSAIFCSALAAGLAATALAQEPRRLVWAGTGGDPLTAGGGRWDANDSVVWSESGAAAGELVKWSNGCAAAFRGTGGGEVNVVDPVTVAALIFERNAAPFLIRTTGASLQIEGAGIVCDSPATQTIEIGKALATFRGAATAGGGSLGSRIRLVSDALVEFTDHASAGCATIENSGELRFSAESSVERGLLVNAGMLALETAVPPAGAAIANHGHLAVGAPFHDGTALFISNGDGGIVDLIRAGNGGPLPLGALANGPESILLCGARTLAVRDLVLAGKSEIGFDLGAERHGAVAVSGIFVGSARGSTRLSITAAGEVTPGRTVALLDWTAATWVSGVELEDFVLAPLPEGVKGRLQIRDRRLLLELAPPGRKGR